MSARQPLDGKPFDPTKLVEIGTAFENACAEIAHHFDETDAQLARTRLAQAVLIVASDHDGHDSSTLKTEALQVLALTYRTRWPLDWH